MKRMFVILGIFLVALVAVGLSGRATVAAEAPPSTDHMVAGAGVMPVHDADDGPARFLIGAATIDGKTRGTLRYAMPGRWVYNGTVRSLQVDDQTATVTGQGTVRDGAGPHRVTFTATLTAGKPGNLVIHIQGQGFDYTCDGPLTKGHVWVQ